MHRASPAWLLRPARSRSRPRSCCRTPVEDRPPALNSSRSRRSGCRSAVHRPWARLRHDHAPRRGRWLGRRSRRGFRTGRSGGLRCDFCRSFGHRRSGWRRGCRRGRSRSCLHRDHLASGRQRTSLGCRSRRHRRLRHHRACRRLRRNRGRRGRRCCRTWRRGYHLGRLARLRNNFSGCGLRFFSRGSGSSHCRGWLRCHRGPGRRCRCGRRCRRRGLWRRRTRRHPRALFLLPPFQQLPGDVPRLVCLRPVDLRLGLGLGLRRRGAAAAPAQDMSAHTLGFVRLDGTRVGLLLRHANCGQSIQNLFALNFQLAR